MTGNIKKEMTVTLETEAIEGLNVLKLIKIIKELIEPGSLLALRPGQNKTFEATFDKTEACEILEDGLIYEGQKTETKRLFKPEVMVSFLHLPPYVGDRDILQRLEKWGVEPILPLRRRFYPGTDVADGTRFIRVRFPKDIVSLPYSTRFETSDGPLYCRVIHDRQVKICRLCMSPDHMLRDCPKFTCRDCLQQGHYARECNAARCTDCQRTLIKCTCLSAEEEEATAEDKELQEGREEGSPKDAADVRSETDGETVDLRAEKETEVRQAQMEPHEQVEERGSTDEDEEDNMDIDGTEDKKHLENEEEGETFNRLLLFKQPKKKKKVILHNIKEVLKKQEIRRAKKKREEAERGKT